MNELSMSFSYGETTDCFKLTLPQGARMNLLEALPVPQLGDFGAAVLQALAEPIGSPPLKELLSPGQKVVIVISDITRQVKSQQFMPVLVEYLNNAGIDDGDIQVLVATGSHRAATADDLQKLLGLDLAERLQVVSNMASQPDEHIYLGTSSRGTPIRVNRLAVNADHVILTGAINYHFLAGFSGGRKSILPGIVAQESIQANHSLVLEAGDKVGQGLVDDNPIAEDMLEAAAMVKPSFLLNVVLNENGQPAGVFAGHWKLAHQAGCDFVASHFGLKVSKKLPLVIAGVGGFPKDLNLYQSAKGLLNAMQAVEDGGTVIFMAQCSEGIGGTDYFRFAAAHWGRQEKEETLRREFSIARYIGYLNSLWARKAAIRLISSLPEEQVKAMGMQPYATLDEALHGITTEELQNCWLIPHASGIAII